MQGQENRIQSQCCCCSVAKSCPTVCDPVDCSTPGLPVLHQLPKFAQTPVHRVGDATSRLVLCRPLLLPPSIFPSIGVFSNESASPPGNGRQMSSCGMGRQGSPCWVLSPFSVSLLRTQPPLVPFTLSSSPLTWGFSSTNEHALGC